jgi:hypothetical protein
LATQAQVTAPERARNFYVAVAVIAAIIVFAGFSRTFFFNSFFAKRNLTSLMILHGIIFSCWLVLLVVQTSLVAADRTDIHRKLGVAGAILAALMIGIGMTLAIHAAKYGFQTPGLPPPLIFLVVPFFDIVVFALLVGAALYYRGQPDTHKRLMLVATISILPPAFARMPFHIISATLPFSAFILGDVVLIGCILWDVAIHRRLHRAYLWGGLLFFLSFPLRMAIAGTSVWQTFARWLTN